MYVLWCRDTLLGHGKVERGFTEVKIASYHRKNWSSFGHSVFFSEASLSELCTLHRRLKVGQF